jgi:hypothetical protein
MPGVASAGCGDSAEFRIGIWHAEAITCHCPAGAFRMGIRVQVLAIDCVSGGSAPPEIPVESSAIEWRYRQSNPSPEIIQAQIDRMRPARQDSGQNLSTSRRHTLPPPLSGTSQIGVDFPSRTCHTARCERQRAESRREPLPPASSDSL